MTPTEDEKIFLDWLTSLEDETLKDALRKAANEYALRNAFALMAPMKDKYTPLMLRRLEILSDFPEVTAFKARCKELGFEVVALVSGQAQVFSITPAFVLLRYA
jgi:hypothetical protein